MKPRGFHGMTHVETAFSQRAGATSRRMHRGLFDWVIWGAEWLLRWPLGEEWTLPHILIDDFASKSEKSVRDNSGKLIKIVFLSHYFWWIARFLIFAYQSWEFPMKKHGDLQSAAPRSKTLMPQREAEGVQFATCCHLLRLFLLIYVSYICLILFASY